MPNLPQFFFLNFRLNYLLLILPPFFLSFKKIWNMIGSKMYLIIFPFWLKSDPSPTPHHQNHTMSNGRHSAEYLWKLDLKFSNNQSYMFLFSWAFFFRTKWLRFILRLILTYCYFEEIVILICCHGNVRKHLEIKKIMKKLETWCQ